MVGSENTWVDHSKIKHISVSAIESEYVAADSLFALECYSRVSSHTASYSAS